jgi:hypothetical protein
VINERQGNSPEKQERPLRESAARDENLAAIANRAFNFSLGNGLNADPLVLARGSYTADERVRFSSTLSRWATLLSAAFLALVLAQKTIDSEIRYT